MGHEFQNLHDLTDPKIDKIRNVFKNLIKLKILQCHASQFSELKHFQRSKIGNTSNFSFGGSWLKSQTGKRLNSIVVFPSPWREVWVSYLNGSYKRFFVLPCQFLIHQTSYHSTSNISDPESILKYKIT